MYTFIVYANQTIKLLIIFISLNFCTKKEWKNWQKRDLYQNILCFNQQIYMTQIIYTVAGGDGGDI